jgi:hypothetical protein
MDGNVLPRLVYVSREKRPSFNHQRKAGALNALVSNIAPDKKRYYNVSANFLIAFYLKIAIK